MGFTAPFLSSLGDVVGEWLQQHRAELLDAGNAVGSPGQDGVAEVHVDHGERRLAGRQRPRAADVPGPE